MSARIPLKAVLVHQHLDRAQDGRFGTDKQAIGMLRLITDAFEHVTIVSPHRDIGPDDEFVPYPDNVSFRSLYQRTVATPRWRTALKHLAGVPRVLDAVRAAQVVQARFPCFPGYVAATAATCWRKPMIITIHGDQGELLRSRDVPTVKDKLVAFAVDRFQKWASGQSALTFIMGHRLRHLTAARANVEVIANYQIEDSQFHRRADTCQGEQVTLIYVGRLSRLKGTDVLLDALTRLPEKFRLLAVGAPVDFDMTGEIARRGLQSRVECTGRLPWGQPLFDAYRRADIMVFPSLSEGAPKVPIEALSQSLPLVATPCGLEGIVEDGVHGLLVPIGDADALASAIGQMAADGALRRSCIEKGMRVAQENTRQRMSERIHGAMARALADQSVGRVSFTSEASI